MKKITRAVLALLTAALVFSGCSGRGSSGPTVYPDMQEAFEQSGLLPANIGIFTKTEQGDATSYGECGSGVIFAAEDGAYYALTAAHVVSTADAQLLVFTVHTEMKEETIPGLDSFAVLTQDTYESMYAAEVVYVSQRDDLAVIRFFAPEELSVVELADSDPEKGDRILCVGNPEGDWFAVSCGTVISGIEPFGQSQGFPSNAMKHSAYIHVGSSGGAAFNEQMKLAGITPGAYLSPDGKTFHCGVLIPISEIRLCLAEWNRS